VIDGKVSELTPERYR